MHLFFNCFRQMSTQLHVGDLSLPSHMAQDICVCCFPALSKLTRSSDLHLSRSYWSPFVLRLVANRGMCSIKCLIIFRVESQNLPQRKLLMLGVRTAFICWLIPSAGYSQGKTKNSDCETRGALIIGAPLWKNCS